MHLVVRYAKNTLLKNVTSTDDALGDVISVLAEQIHPHDAGLEFTLLEADTDHVVSTSLMGKFNVENLLACYSSLRACGLAANQARHGLESVSPVAGRMERFGGKPKPSVVVDYAHTPQALQLAIDSVRVHCQGQLWVVFGCGGDRDPGKRAPMARAAQAADVVVLTDDNPRMESSEDIIAAVLEGFDTPEDVIVIADRSKAIQYAIDNANTGDLVLVAGKGHEDYQTVGTTRLPFSDKEGSIVCVGGGLVSMGFSLSDCQTALQADLIGQDQHVSGVSIDTRTLKAGDLYVAIQGENFNGHEFVAAAQEAGATAVLVHESVDTDLPQLVVEDTVVALGRLATWWASRFGIPLIAVTGSNGKTSVKEIITAILKQLGPVLSTKGNLNNEIGVPLTLLGMRAEHLYAVVEMGANHAGEIARLVQIAKPDIAIVNNIGSAHLEGFGSTEGIARAKSEIYSGLSEDGYAIINADDAFADFLRESASHCNKRDFGLTAGADVQGVPGAGLIIETLGTSLSPKFQLTGDHNGMNALAAVQPDQRLLMIVITLTPIQLSRLLMCCPVTVALVT